MRGRDIHNEKLERNKSYLRKKIGVQKKWLDQYLGKANLRGKIDEVLQLDDGTFAPLDYKFAHWKNRIYETYKQQLICYALLIEENFDARVNKGFLVYVRSSHKLVEVEISDKDKEQIEKSTHEMLEIINKNKYPKATKSKKKCLNCTYRNICTK